MLSITPAPDIAQVQDAQPGIYHNGTAPPPSPPALNDAQESLVALALANPDVTDDLNPNLTHPDCDLLFRQLSETKSRPKTIARLEEIANSYDPENQDAADALSLATRLSGHIPPDAVGREVEVAHKLAAEIGEAPPTLVLGYPATDTGNAERFAQHHGRDVRFCAALGGWHFWDGTRWRLDKTGDVKRMGKATVRRIGAEAAATEDDDKRKELLAWARKSESKARRADMLSLAESEPGMAVEAAAFDAYLWLLNCKNGTLDLRTGALRPHRRADLLTKRAPIAYDPLAKCPVWLAFLGAVMADRPALVEFLQRAIGYALTGDTREQVFFILHGGGANGKSTLLNILALLMGDYAQQTDTDALMAKSGGGINNDLARLRGARLVSAVETEAGKRLAEVKIKQLTGGDTVTARFLFQEFFEFKPLFKLFLATNHKPEIRGTDNAIWRRVRLVPFDVTFTPEQQDKALADKLRAELPGILAWAVQGCLKWQRTGLGEPDEVKAATRAYREEQDLVALFLSDCCIIEQHAQVTAKELNAAYQDWCKDSGEKPITAIELGKRLTERGLRAKKGTGGVRKWLGLGLLSDPQATLLSGANSGAFAKVAHSGAETELVAQNNCLVSNPEKCATMRHSTQNAPLLNETDTRRDL